MEREQATPQKEAQESAPMESVIQAHRRLRELKDAHTERESQRVRQELGIAGRFESGQDSDRKPPYDVLNSESYRVGLLMVEAFKHPGKNTLLLPFRLARLMFEVLSDRKRARKP